MLNHYAVYMKLITWEVNSISIKILKGSIVIYGMCLSFSFSLFGVQMKCLVVYSDFFFFVHERMIKRISEALDNIVKMN